MNDLELYFTHNPGRLIHKWHHYFEIYDRHFSRFRDQPVCLIEFGVFHGGSLQMWKQYFGHQARLIGVDIDPRCKALEEEQITIVIGDQENRTFLRELGVSIPRIDIVIDDGGHTMRQQKATLEVLLPMVHEDGVYLCEDLHTSYWPKYGGGYKRPGTFVEKSKELIDDINAWHATKADELKVSEVTRSVHSLHFYDSVLVIEKRPTQRPRASMTGTPSFEFEKPRLGHRLARRGLRWLRDVAAGFSGR